MRNRQNEDDSGGEPDHLRRLVGHLILLGALAALALPAPAFASPDQVISDCVRDGKLDRHYSNSELRRARNNLPADLDEYSDCRDVIAAAIKGGSDKGLGAGSPGIGATDPAGEALGRIRAKLEDFSARLKQATGRDYSYSFSVEARYRFQVWDLETPLPGASIDSPDDVRRLVEEFHRVHERVFAIRDDESIVEFLNWKGRVTVHLDRPPPTRVVPESRRSRPRSTRPAYFGAGKRLVTPVLRDDDIRTGSTTTSGNSSSSIAAVTASTTAALASMPIFVARSSTSAARLSSCASTRSASSATMRSTPAVFCTVTAVIALTPYTPNAANVFRSA